MTVTVTIDRRTVMQDAWRRTRALGAALLGLYGIRQAFRLSLIEAWAQAKRRAALLSEGAAYLRGMAEALTQKRWLTDAEAKAERDYYALAAEAEQIEAEQEAAAAQAEKRDLIASAGGRFCTVTFTKKDGTARVMKVQPAALRQHIKGEAASKAAKIAAATRAARHQHLLNVWDVEAQAPRSINLATVTRIATGGAVYTYA